jgi:hypothetical protein
MDVWGKNENAKIKKKRCERGVKSDLWRKDEFSSLTQSAPKAQISEI